MLYLSVQSRIVLAYVVLVSIAMLIFGTYLLGFIRDSYENSIESNLQAKVLLFADGVQAHGLLWDDFVGLHGLTESAGAVSDGRVTVTDSAGKIVADTWTNASQWDVALQTEEIVAAMGGEIDIVNRVSSITNSKMVYVAVPVFDDQSTVVAVARMGVSLDSIDSNMDWILWTVVTGSVAILILSIVVAVILSKRITFAFDSITEGARAISVGDLDYKLSMDSQDSIGLATAFNRMGANMKALITDLSLEKEKLNIVLDTLADGVILVDGGQRIVLLNHAAIGIIHVGETDALGRSLIEVTREYEIERTVAVCLSLQQTQYTELLLHSGYRSFTLVVTPMPLGSYLGCLITMHDVTELVQLETTRREFVSNVSHELRTPLTAVRMIAETLQNGGLEDQQITQGYVKRIILQVDSMTQLVADLLALSLLDKGKINLDLENILLRDLLNELQYDLSTQIKAKNITLDTMDLNIMEPIACDRNRLKQVLSNLMENAIKFTNINGVIKLDACKQGMSIIIRVIDTGIGISHDDIPHIFERFYKADRSRGYEGTGLGLAIAKHIVQLHGGSLSVKSDVGEGSEFVIILPYVVID